MPLSSPRLWIVATPIGNPGDLSPRARAILAEADVILAEDTRRAGLLLAACGIKAKKLLSFYEHNEQDRQLEVMRALGAGMEIALVSDAGTPLLSDPGFRLVRACRKEGFSVSPVPGPAAPIAALSAAGVPPLPFTFLGFLPRAGKQRKDLFTLYGSTPATLVFFERKDRVRETLAIARTCLGDREFVICRELTKEYEEFIVGNLADVETGCLSDNLLGEITILIGPPAQTVRTPLNDVKKLLEACQAKGMKNRAAAKTAKTQCSGWSVAELYELLAKSPKSFQDI